MSPGAARLGPLAALLLALLGAGLPPPLAAFMLNDGADNEISVEPMPAQGELLVIWLLDHAGERPQFEAMLQAIQAQGIEVWRVDLLADYFLPRSNENARRLPGDPVAALIRAAHRRSGKRILLAAYDRMPLPLLRGLRQWQADPEPQPRLIGALLFYPNLFGPTPAAGRAPQLDPIVAASNFPLFLYQPALGAQRWRLDTMMEAFWSAGAPAYVWLLPEVRDWFFMHPPGADPAEDRASAAVAAGISDIAALLDAAPKPERPAPLAATPATRAEPGELLAFAEPTAAPALNLRDMQGQPHRLADYRGALTLVNFWATWCPPCVEEVPSLNRLAARYPDSALRVVSIDYRETPQAIGAFRERVPVHFPILLDQDGRAALDWQVFAFPSTFLLDRQGRIRYSVNRAIDWDTPALHRVIDELLQEPGKQTD